MRSTLWSTLSGKRLLLFIIGVIAALAVLTMSASAHATAAYPPTQPTTTGSSYGVSQTSIQQPPDGDAGVSPANESGRAAGTASTGFDALIASSIAVGLLGVGVLLLLGTRRKRSGRSTRTDHLH